MLKLAKQVACAVAVSMMFSLSATAQRPTAAAEDTARAMLGPVKWMVGEWTGPASGTNGGQSYSVMQHEKVTSAASGTVLLIQGRGSQGDKTVFEAAGFLSYDMGTHAYKWVSSGGTGYVGISDAVVRGDTLVWTTPGGGGSRTRYLIWKSPKGEWREIGEISRDNVTWTRTFEMTLVTKEGRPQF